MWPYVPHLLFCALGLLVPTQWVRGDTPESVFGAYLPGDIMIGILSSDHSKVTVRTQPGSFTCTDFNLASFVRSLAAVHTIETINNSGFLPGIQLGYIMCDPCSDATKALHCVEHFLSINGSMPVLYDYTHFLPPVKVILGERYSELSIAVAKLLSVYMFPQVSTTSSAEILSDKQRFPSFLRVIPNDEYQTKAMAKFLKGFEWNWVGIVHGDDDYGTAASWSFMAHAEQEHVCIAFHEKLPHYLDYVNVEQRIKEVAARIRSCNATVIVLILRPEEVEMLFKEMIRTNTSRTWIASDSWSMYRPLMKLRGIERVGNIFGFSFITGQVPGFDEYLRNLKPSQGARNHFISEYKQLRLNCTLGHQTDLKAHLPCNLSELEADDEFLIQHIELSEVYSERVAVWAIAHAMKSLLGCNETICTAPTNFRPWQLLKKLREVSFTLDNHTYFFNEYGDFAYGYDLIKWKKNSDNADFKVVGQYRIREGEVSVSHNLIDWDSENNKKPESKCSSSCKPGYMKRVSDIHCCYSCTICVEGTYSDNWDQDDCKNCSSGTWALKGQSSCSRRTLTYLKWAEAYPIALMVGAGIGILLVFITVIIFIVHRTCPLVKMCNLEMSCYMAFGLMVSFASVVAFIDMPNIHLCRAQQTMYGLGFTLCVSCILVKAFRTFLAFMAYDPGKKHNLLKLYKPRTMIITFTTVQGLVCLFWLIFASPDVHPEIPSPQKMTINVICTEGSIAGFGVMHGYIALLAFICFLLAFKGRKVPQDYNETSCIIFSMIIHLFVWLCFIPIYITKNEQRPILQASAILVSSYGIIFCHFIPKCYLILWEKQENSKTALRQRLHTSIQGSIASMDIISRAMSSEGNGYFSSQDPDIIFIHSKSSNITPTRQGDMILESDITNISVRQRARFHSL